jgi:hypothetical protein
MWREQGAEEDNRRHGWITYERIRREWKWTWERQTTKSKTENPGDDMLRTHRWPWPDGQEAKKKLSNKNNLGTL